MGNYVPTDLELSLSDLNEDNQIDVLDVVMLVNLVLSKFVLANLRLQNWPTPHEVLLFLLAML